MVTAHLGADDEAMPTMVEGQIASSGQQLLDPTSASQPHEPEKL
jgi:hypothetical protein